MTKKKSLLLISIAALLIVTITITISYGFWKVSKVEDTTNIITSGNLSFAISSEENALNLENAIPITDEKANDLTPFTFTITNNGDIYTDYTVNLEVLSGLTLKTKYIASKLNDNEKKILNVLPVADITESDSVEAKTLVTGGLSAGASVTYTLRLWMDQSTPYNDDTRDKIFKSKIVVISEARANQKESAILIPTTWNDETGFRSLTYREKIKKIIFEDVIDIPQNVHDNEKWDVSESQNGSIMAYVTPNETRGYYNLHIASNNNILANENMSYWFSNLKSLEKIENLDLLDTSFTTNMAGMFNATGYNSLSFQLDVSCFDVSNVTNMNTMFYNTGYNAKDFSLILGDFNSSKVIYMEDMFNGTGYNANALVLNLKGIKTNNVISMKNMFYNAGSHASEVNIDLSGWTNEKVENMRSMFSFTGANASKVTLNLTKFKTPNVTTMNRMFLNFGNYTKDLSLNLTSFDTSKVKDMSYMFNALGFNSEKVYLNINGFKVDEVTNMSSMFQDTAFNATDFILDIGGFRANKLETASNMFTNMGYMSTNLNFTITLSSDITSYVDIFKNVGGMVTVNYTSDASAIIDDVVNTKENANVNKGKLISL